MPICCADIPRLPGLESIRFRAGLQGGNNVIRWPYVAENDSIAPWVKGGEIVFVTGINHHRDEENLKQLVVEAVNHQVAGIVVLTGPEFIREIPASVLTLANDLNFPILEQPYSLKMVVVTEVISNAIVQDNLLGQSIRLFLTRLINGYADAPELIHLKAVELGLSDQRPYAAIAVRLVDQTVSKTNDDQWRALHLKNQLENELTNLLKRRDNSWPVLVHEHDLLVLWPVEGKNISVLSSEIEQATSFLQKQISEIQLFLGVSELQTSLSGLSLAVEQAKQSVQFAIQHQNQPIFFYEQLGIARLFAAIPQRQLLVQFCREQLGVLCFSSDIEYIKLKETLRQYLNQFGNHQNASEELTIHRNTLRYRLKKIEELIGASLEDPFIRLNLQNALLIEQILFHNYHLDIQ